MSEATLILPNMRGGCATADGKVHTLFRINSRVRREMAKPAAMTSSPPAANDDHPSDDHAREG
ncbi:hypothetical protein BJ123_1164 [Rhodopseudomonas thermotolerans]|uniref:Uncharacterized protein n=2 Tax=Rhodopseudomonas TaxID=1073 RepID=A0A336JV33_9BRAD|nr:MULTISPECIES: hypothetical protein [Rhodopseudomonas]RED30496.1 hypothetical protein BJ125_1164 [Rhodopseudomonas pentothenatexigens]REF92600.1 hypothetical protein BJ123_1164 [Rhodopseudomonas thermotolerans]SSW92029.1 hypothetical protein SAMN05892882_1164 [Rhodopseudomonas pentothenatexigens]